MKQVKIDEDAINHFVASLYENGSTPSEKFGMSRQFLSDLELDAPEVIIKTAEYTRRKVC